MPTYTYKNQDSGQILTKIWPIAKMLEEEGDNDGITVDGRFYYRSYTDEHSHRPEGGCAAWPQRSDAAGAHPDQCKEFYESITQSPISKDGGPSRPQRRLRRRLNANGRRKRNA